MANLMERIGRYYRLGLYQAHHLEKLVRAGALTREQLEAITGERWTGEESGDE